MKAFLILAREQALLEALAAGREKEGELTTTSLEFKFHPPPIRPIPLWLPVTQLSDFRQSARSGNWQECK